MFTIVAEALEALDDFVGGLLTATVHLEAVYADIDVGGKIQILTVIAKDEEFAAVHEVERQIRMAYPLLFAFSVLPRKLVTEEQAEEVFGKLFGHTAYPQRIYPAPPRTPHPTLYPTLVDEMSVDEKVRHALVEGDFLSPDQLKVAEAKAQATGKRLTEVLLADEMMSPEALAMVFGLQLNVPVVDLRQFRIQPKAVALVSEEFAREHQVLAYALEGDVLRVVMEDLRDEQLVYDLTELTRKLIRPVLPLRGGLKEAIDKAYGARA